MRCAIPASVVVGTNGSAAGHDAVEWAAAEAAARSRGLTIVHAEPELVRSHQRRTSGHSGLQENTDPLLEEAVRRARVVAPDVPIRARDIVGGAIPALLGQQPEMIVVGDRGRRSSSRPGGSLCFAIASYAICPVVVVRLQARTVAPQSGLAITRRSVAGRVVVGLGGTAVSPATLEFAFRAALQRGVGLTAIIARPSTMAGDVVEELAPLGGSESTPQPNVTTMLERFDKAYPSVEVATTYRPGPAAEVLIEGSEDAALLVVGTRERSALGRRLFGSVSHSVLEGAGCPVAVIHRLVL